MVTEKRGHKNPLTLLPGVWKKSTVLLFNTTNQIVNERLADELHRDGFDISPRAVWVLMAASERPQSQRMIADCLNINANVMVRMVDDLEKRGLLRRLPGKTRREHKLEVTDSGLAILQRMAHDWDARTARVFHPVSMKQVRQYVNLARSIINDHYANKKTGPKRRFNL